MSGWSDRATVESISALEVSRTATEQAINEATATDIAAMKEMLNSPDLHPRLAAQIMRTVIEALGEMAHSIQRDDKRRFRAAIAGIADGLGNGIGAILARLESQDKTSFINRVMAVANEHAVAFVLRAHAAAEAEKEN